jgi:hypothetical protein
LNGNGPGAGELMPYHYLLAGSLVFRDLAHFSSHVISAYKKISSLSFRVTLGLCTKIVLIWFRWSSFLAHEMRRHFSPSSVFNARSFSFP